MNNIVFLGSSSTTSDIAATTLLLLSFFAWTALTFVIWLFVRDRHRFWVVWFWTNLCVALVFVGLSVSQGRKLPDGMLEYASVIIWIAIIRFLIKWIRFGWPGRAKEGKGASIWWAILKTLSFAFSLFCLWFFASMHFLGEHYKKDNRNAMYTSPNGQVVMKYDDSQWDAFNDEHLGLFKLIRKSNHNIAIYVTSTLENRMSLEELIEGEKKAMVADYGPRCVYKNALLEENRSVAGLHFVLDEGKASEEMAMVKLGAGKFGAFIVLLLVPKQGEDDERDTDPEVNRAFYTWAAADLHVP